jgi:hypothetical protein
MDKTLTLTLYFLCKFIVWVWVDGVYHTLRAFVWGICYCYRIWYSMSHTACLIGLFLKYSWYLWMVISFSFDLLSPLSWLNWVFLSVYPSIYLFVWHLPIQIKNLVAVFFSVCLLIWMFFCSLSPYLVPWRRLFLLHVSVHILVRSNNWHLLPHTCP